MNNIYLRSEAQKEIEDFHEKFKCIKCKLVFNKNELSIENYGVDYELERYCCPKCDGTCLDIEDVDL